MQLLLKDCLNLHDEPGSDFSELDYTLFDYVINSIERDDEGRLIAPALWDSNVEHLLARNFDLARKILKSTVKKLQKIGDALRQYDAVINEQLKDGIICRVDDINEFLRTNPDAAFMPHSGVIREDSETTKLRVVFLSNLSEKAQGISHNAISHPGPNLNHSLFHSLLLLRFSNYLLTFDLCKAFLQIRVRERDSHKLLFLWYKDPLKGDFTPVCYRFLRLGFGLRFSPFVLLSCLWFILMRNNESDSENLRRIKKVFYALTYMDNISFTADDPKEVEFAYQKSFEIFNAYKFDLQKFYTNCGQLQSGIDTYLEEDSPQVVDLLGLKWNRSSDTFACAKFSLDSSANTKRKILSSVNSVFDLCGIVLPIMNRAKFFLHGLQLQEDLGWDDVLNNDQIREWQCICKQIEHSANLKITRSFGSRDSTYNLIACSDASKDALGCCFYLWDAERDVCTFLAGKNRMIDRNLRTKSIPVLELLALTWATEVSMSLYRFLVKTICPIKINSIIIYCDSSISLCWIRSKISRTSKIERKAVLVNNKLNKIVEETKTHSVVFRHLEGKHNPADCLTRSISAAVLNRSNYHAGPSLRDPNGSIDEIHVPYLCSADLSVFSVQTEILQFQPVINIDRYSSFKRATQVMNFVFKFVQIRVYERNPDKYKHLYKGVNTYMKAQRYLIKAAQQQAYPKVLDFFRGKVSKCEPIITQLNLFLDRNGIIRVKSKLGKLESETYTLTPILLSKSCQLTEAVIEDLHLEMKHGQIYKLLAALRKEFYVPKAYSLVKLKTKNCVMCRQLYGRGMTFNINNYPNFRINPSKRPFSTIMIDSIGPYHVQEGNSTVKNYLLLLTCMFTRGINLIVCRSLSSEEFLHALQLHILEYGIMETVVSDNQPSFVNGMSCLANILGSVEIKNFLKVHNIKKFSFEPYPSGASYLGGAVESLVKQVKNVLYTSIAKNKVTSHQFLFLAAEAKALVNKRIIGFKSSLTNELASSSVPFALTPELLLKGYEVPSFNILGSDKDDEKWEPPDSSSDALFDYFKQLNDIRNKIQRSYETEFLKSLEWQAVNKPNRYKARNQSHLAIGDLVAIKAKLLKPFYYPRGVVTNIEYNDINEVKAVTVRKANGESLRRHPSDIIILMHSAVSLETDVNQQNQEDEPWEQKPQRMAKTRCILENKNLALHDLV